MGCDFSSRSIIEIVLYFNPRTHVGCDFVATKYGLTSKISIHAPMWGATQWISLLSTLMLFQSTHPCGVRRKRLAQNHKLQYFNPRTHVGCDCARHTNVRKSGISIHAPMWGATGWSGPCVSTKWISIHAPMWGATTFTKPSAPQ